MNIHHSFKKQIIEKGLGASLLSSILGSIIYTIVTVLALLHRKGVYFVFSTLKYNLTTFLEAVLSFFLAGVCGIIIGYWLWTDIKKGTFSKKMSILKGWFIGTAAGVLVSAFIVYNSIRRLGLQSFYIELITGLVLWMLGGILTSWVIAQFIGENLDNQN